MGADASSDASNKCVDCGTLQAACPTDIGCPPDLGTAGFDSWVQSFMADGGAWSVTCDTLSDCPELVVLIFATGVDCEKEYFFDAATHKLVAVTGTCAGFGIFSCGGADGCFPERCEPLFTKTFTPSTACSLPDA